MLKYFFFFFFFPSNQCLTFINTQKIFFKQFHKDRRDTILRYEKDLLEFIGFDFVNEHPHKYIIKFGKKLGGFFFFFEFIYMINN